MNDTTTRIWTLTDQQALSACAALATTLELELNVKNLDTSRFDQLVAGASARERALYADVEHLSEHEAAVAARSMLRLAADLGYADAVDRAIASSAIHGRDFGVVSGPLLVAGLAVVLAYVPVEQRNKVTRIYSHATDGSERAEVITESETKRVGAAAVEKLAGWWKAVLAG